MWTKMGRGERKSNNAAVLMIALIVTALQDAAMATEYTVGSATGWDFAPTSSYYDDWAAGLKFVPGDKLVFKYLPSAHNVQEVTEADYQLCNSLNPIAEYETGNDIITLPKPGTHFYICGFLGHCDQGGMRMKATIVGASSTPLIPVNPPTSPELPSPMTSIIPQLPGPAGNGSISNPPHAPHGHAHPPAAAPISVPGHSAGDQTQVPMSMARLLVLSFGVVSVISLFW